MEDCLEFIKGLQEFKFVFFRCYSWVGGFVFLYLNSLGSVGYLQGLRGFFNEGYFYWFSFRYF